MRKKGDVGYEVHLEEGSGLLLGRQRAGLFTKKLSRRRGSGIARLIGSGFGGLKYKMYPNAACG